MTPRGGGSGASSGVHGLKVELGDVFWVGDHVDRSNPSFRDGEQEGYLRLCARCPDESDGPIDQTRLCSPGPASGCLGHRLGAVGFGGGTEAHGDVNSGTTRLQYDADPPAPGIRPKVLTSRQPTLSERSV
jgi:hypothetical protein